METYQNEHTHFYVNQVQNGTLTLNHLEAYEHGVACSLEQFGDDDDGRDTQILQGLREAQTILQSQP